MNKKFLPLLIILMLGFGLQTSGQDDMQFLFQKKDAKVKVSGFAGPFVEFTTIDNDFAVCAGGGGALLLNQIFWFGGYGEGLATVHQRRYEKWNDISGENETIYDQKLFFGHGGFWLGYIFFPKKPVHFNVNTKIGWGSVGYSDYYGHYDYEYDSPYRTYKDNVFVFIPQVEAELNLLKWMRVNFGVGYRVVSGVNSSYLKEEVPGEGPIAVKPFENKDWSGVTGSVTFAFGWFDQ
jgi:hypothetical protein